MKILFFIDSLAAGGKERRLTELLKSLSLHQEFECEVVIMNKEIHYKEVLYLKIPIHYLVRTTKKDLSVFKKFYNICKDYKPDIVHCWNDMTAVIAVPSCILLNIKLVNGMVSDAPIRLKILSKEWLYTKLTFRFSNIIIGNSEAGLNAYKAPKYKSFVIYNGFNFKRIENLISRDKIRNELKINTKFVIGMVASFSKYKDYKTYFNAAHTVLSKRNDVTFIAIGNNTDSVASLSLIDQKYKEGIKLIGKKTNIESYINSMDVCVLATFTEGISNSIMEYMALGKPVIATFGGGTTEIVENGKTGFLVNKFDQADLAEKIDLLLNDHDLRSKMGENGQERIHKMFCIDLMVSKYVSFYKKLEQKLKKKPEDKVVF